jgi:LPXTG-motif cell wall-anchored protein
VIEVVASGSEHPRSSPEPSEASASQKAAGGEAEVLADTGGTNLAVYAGLGFVGLVLSALLARRLLG